MTRRRFRIGQIVPSSNVTMETEIPALFRARETVAPERFTFHSSRMRMKEVRKEELAAMDADSTRCAADQMMRVLGLPAFAPGAGSLLAGKYAETPIPTAR